MAILRTFFAVPVVPPPALAGVLDDLRGLGRSLKVVEFGQLHLTLRFVGATDEAVMPQLRAALQKAVAGLTPGTLDLSGLGAFPSPAKATIIWGGVRPGPAADTLATLAQRLEAGVTELGFAPENRPFHPHLTLARVRNRPPKAWSDFYSRRHEVNLGQIPMTAVQLIVSELGSAGPEYSVAATALLG